MALLSAHYGQPLDWSDRTLTEADKTLNKWYSTLAAVQHIEVEYTDATAAMHQKFSSVLNDNMNTPQALHLLHQWFKALNAITNDKSGADSGNPDTILNQQKRLKADILAAGQLLGILQDQPKKWLDQQKNYKAQQALLTEQDINQLLVEREQARKARNFTRADAIRNQLLTHNIMIDDSPQGTTWRYK